jgi:hypothetical protein
MPLFEMSAENYLPALPVYVDNINTILSYNQWCGEALALAEFNQSHNHRKFVENHRSWGIDNLYTFHVFDHPFRLGLKTPPNPLFIYPNY